MNNLKPVSKDLIFKGRSSDDPRLGDFVRVMGPSDDFPDTDFVLCGYADDEGIGLNGGRPGARLAPSAIRKPFYKFTPDIHHTQPVTLADLGDIDSEVEAELALRHELGRKLCAQALGNNQRWIAWGGGHDYGYCESTAFLERYKNDKPLIINFDAHLDVRPFDQNLSSGTPFRRLLTEFKDTEFTFLEVGIQSFCNARAHLQWALSHPATQIIEQETIDDVGLHEALAPVLDTHADRPTLISIDIDAFDAATAPGASQSWPGGLDPREFFKVFKLLIEKTDVRALGIYEVSPPLDTDGVTTKLAALITERFIRYAQRKGVPT